MIRARTLSLHSCALTALLALLSVPALSVAQAPPKENEQVIESAKLLMRSSMAIHRDGEHNRMLGALRHLRDPALKPLFERLAGSTHPSLQIHGILGLAEVDPARKLDLLRLASVQDGRVQAEIVTAAMDSGLLDNDAAQQLMQWKDLDPAVKMLVTMQLIRSKQPVDRALLAESAQSDNLARQGLGSLLLLELGDEKSLQALVALNQSQDPQRDQVRAMVLNTALRYQFESIAPWAWKVSIEQGAPDKLAQLALRAAMRFGAVGAEDLWVQKYRTSNDIVDRTRLALMALELSPWLKPDVFKPLKESDDDLIRRMGAAGEAVATHRQLAECVVALIELHHTMANRWSLEYAEQQASDVDAIQILLALILAVEQDGSDRTMARRLDAAVQASRVLIEKDHDKAVALLKPKVASPDTDPMLVQGILLGLVQSRSDAPHDVVEGLMPLSNANAQRMAVYLVARHGKAGLTENQMQDMVVLIRGGGGLPDTIRLQAAWTYLKITRQSDDVLAQVLRG